MTPGWQRGGTMTRGTDGVTGNKDVVLMGHFTVLPARGRGKGNLMLFWKAGKKDKQTPYCDYTIPNVFSWGCRVGTKNDAHKAYPVNAVC